MITLHPHIHPESATMCTKLRTMETEKRSLSSRIRVNTNTLVCKQFPSYYIIILFPLGQKPMRQPIVTIPIHILDTLTQIGFEAVTTTSSITSPHQPLRIKAIPDKLESPLGGFQRFLPRVPTLRLWAALTQPLSWEGIEKFSEFQGNHQSTKEEGIPYTFSLTQVHKHTLAHAFKATITRQYKLQKPLSESYSQILKCNLNITRPLAPPRCISHMPTDTRTCMHTRCQTQR